MQQHDLHQASGKIAGFILNGGILTSDEVVDELRQDTSKAKVVEGDKAARKAERETRSFADAQGRSGRRHFFGPKNWQKQRRKNAKI